NLSVLGGSIAQAGVVSAAGGYAGGGLTNTGTIMATSNATFNGSSLGAQLSTVAAGVEVNVAGGQVNGAGQLVGGGNFVGNITNPGTIIASTAASENGSGTTGLSSVAAGLLVVVRGAYAQGGSGGMATGLIINSGTIAATATGTAAASAPPPLSGATGISVSVLGGGSGGGGGVLKGGITNTGLLSVTSNSAVGLTNSSGIEADIFGGTATQAGQHSVGGVMEGNIVNTGVITVSGSGGAAAAQLERVLGIGVGFANASQANGGTATEGTFSGGITNAGRVAASASGAGEIAIGIAVGNASRTVVESGVFTGAIVNSGTVSALGTGGADGVALRIATPIAGGVTNTGVIMGSTAAISLQGEAGGATALHQDGGMIAGSLIGSGSGSADTLSLTGGTILLSPAQKITGFGVFTQTGGTLTLQVTPTAAPQISADSIVLAGTVHVIPALGAGNFQQTQTFKEVFTAAAPIAFAGASVTVPQSVFTAALVPDAANANALDLTLALSPSGLAASAEILTQSLRFGLEAPEVMRDSIRHRLVEGSSYDGGGITTAALSDPSRQIAGGSGVLASPSARGGLWARGYGVVGDGPAAGAAPSFQIGREGLVVGGDWQLNDHIIVGIAADYDHTNASFSDASSTRLDAYQAAAYAGWGEGPWYATGLLGAGINEFSTTRQLAPFGFAGAATASPSGETYETYGEAGYHLRLGRAALVPYLGVGYTRAQIDAFTEAGGFGALAVSAGSSDSLATTLGARVSAAIDLGGGKLVPELRVGYRHEFLDAAQSLNASFATTPFSASGANFGRDTALIGVGVTGEVTGTTRVFLDYDGALTGSFQQHAFSAGVKVRF
ncbi:MAG TPA: autotransporter domain-containing protein, partial [Stellaceae bacterium]|nr:autotransporter domain-containing protein [Stellaceae bacterium]